MSNPSDFVIENGVLKKYVGPGGDVIVPEGVTSIGYRAFYYCSNLASVNLPQSLTSIEVDAFDGCIDLTSISLPDSLIRIESGAFRACNLLSTLQIPNAITELKSALFSGCKALRSVTLSANLTSIGYACFGSCESLDSITIPATVKTIEDRAFSGCTALKEIVLPEVLEYIGETAFKGCGKFLKIHCSGAIFGMLCKETKDNLTKSWLTGSAEYGKDQTDAIKKYAGRAKDRLFTEIEGDDEESISRLLTCGKMKPEMLETYIQKCNDGQHPKMMAVLLNYQNKTVSPKKKEEIAEKAIGLVEKTAKDLAKTFRWEEDAEGIVITKYKGIEAEVEIPDQIDGKSIVKIGKNAFKNNSQVQFIRIPASVTEILESAFEKCASLKEVLWSENLCIIEKRAFWGCETLTGTLDLPQTVKSLGVNAFSGCNYSEIKLPEGLESIAGGALDCGNYTELHVPASVIKMGGCTGYFTGDLYIHGMKTKIDIGYYDQMPMTIHAPAGSYIAKCASEGKFIMFKEMSI